MNHRGASHRKWYTRQLKRCFPPVSAFKDSEHVTVEDPEDLEFTTGAAPIQLGSSTGAKPDNESSSGGSVVVRRCVSSSKSYTHLFDVRPSVLETNVEEVEPRSDLTRAVLESVWSDDSEGSDDDDDG
jgi:hypothetical protein